MTNDVTTAFSNPTVNTKLQFIKLFLSLPHCKNLPFIEKVDMDGDDGQIETVEETSRGESDDEFVMGKVNIC